MGIHTEVRCDGEECVCCFFARDKREDCGRRFIDCECWASDKQREECNGGEKGHFYMPDEVEFIEKR